MSSIRSILIACVAAVGLTVLFWLPLWRGGGFVGGDVYSYYLPQKVFYAERLADGEFPLWNNRAGHGYPLVGESQTGPFYPFHLLLYTTLDVNTAYNVNHLLHYVLAFGFAWLLARSLGLSAGPAMLAAVVYTYGWFPPRSCWEWAIIGGTWLPASLWCVERFLQTRLWRYAIGLSAVLAVQMVAGHFNIAFITQLTLAAYIPLRLWMADGDLPVPTRAVRGRAWAILLVAVGVGFLLAAPQLAPTWDFKDETQRAIAGEHHPLAHGSIPTGYWTQMIQPWRWYSFDVDRDPILERMSQPLGAKTNQVEAHLYFGLVPLGLALAGLMAGIRSGERRWILWLLLGLAALIYSSGRLVPWATHLPGFNFFQGPGRFGIVTTLGVALLAARGLQSLWIGRSAIVLLWTALLVPAALFSTYLLAAKADAAHELAGQTSSLQFAGFEFGESAAFLLLFGGGALAVLGTALAWRSILQTSSRETPSSDEASNTAAATRSKFGRGARTGLAMVIATVFAATIVDLWVVGRSITYVQMVDDPPIKHLDESPVRRLLAEYDGLPRLFAPGANLPTVLGASSYPVYLTFGPKEYVDPALQLPPVENAEFAQLQPLGITHMLSFEPLGQAEWAKQIWSGYDPLLNPAWARFREPLYLYEVAGADGRVSLRDESTSGRIDIDAYAANRVAIDVDSGAGGLLVLRDLMSPGWTVRIDDADADPVRVDDVFRGVQVPSGSHRVVWTYRPRSLLWGIALCAVAILLLAVVAHVRYWHPQRLRWFNEERTS